jgi:hypothetical protein
MKMKIIICGNNENNNIILMAIMAMWNGVIMASNVNNNNENENKHIKAKKIIMKAQ